MGGPNLPPTTQIVNAQNSLRTEFSRFFLATAVVSSRGSVRADNTVAWDGRVEVLVERVPHRAASARASGGGGDFAVRHGFPFRNTADDRKHP